MDQVKFQAQRETWIRATAAYQAAVARRSVGFQRLNDDVERAEHRMMRERNALQLMRNEAAYSLDRFLNEPTEAELQTALELIGEAPEKPDPKERPADMPAPTPEVTCSHGAGVYENPGDPPGVWRCNQCNTRVDANGQPLPADPVN